MCFGHECVYEANTRHEHLALVDEIDGSSLSTMRAVCLRCLGIDRGKANDDDRANKTKEHRLDITLQHLSLDRSKEKKETSMYLGHRFVDNSSQTLFALSAALRSSNSSSSTSFLASSESVELSSPDSSAVLTTWNEKSISPTSVLTCLRKKKISTHTQ